MDLQQINVVRAETLKTLLYTLFDVHSIDPQNVCIFPNETQPLWITAHFCRYNNLLK